MSAYYNEFDKHAAQWLRNLIAAGLIAPGDVDERSIADVRADDLAGYRQCHFFAGIGIWSHALRMAGWPDDREVWTGSCPCQPFSTAGQGKGFDDERHLWPVWVDLIRECRPKTIFGEQVSSASTVGRSSGLLTLRHREAYWRILEDRLEGDVSDCLQDLQEYIRSGGQFSSEIVDGFEGQPFGFWSESQISRKTSAVRPVREVGKEAVGRGGLRDNRGSVRHGAGEELGHTVVGQDRTRKGVYGGEHATRDICCEHDDGGLGRGSGENGRPRTSRHSDCKVERFEQGSCEGATGEDEQAWIDTLFLDLERACYTVGVGDFPAAGVGAPHIRQRLWFVADAECGAAEPRRYDVGGTAREVESREGERQRIWAESRAGRNAGRLDHHHHHQRLEGLGRGHQAEGGRHGAAGSVAEAGESGRMGDDDGAGSQSGWEAAEATGYGRTAVADGGAGRPGPTNGYWRDADWLFCRDGKWRPVESGTFPLAHGTAFRLDSGSAFEGKSRQGLLKGFGNGIVPQVAAQIIEAFMEYRP